MKDSVPNKQEALRYKWDKAKVLLITLLWQALSKYYHSLSNLIKPTTAIE
jgi:hypothetical protein